MAEKLSFTIDNAELVEDNPNSSFAILSLDFFASGRNKHNTYVSEETLLRTAGTIRNCPVVWKYDPVLDDVGTHDPEESPCGFIPRDTFIESKKLEDGRTMLSVLSFVWKRYSGKLLEFFRRDGDKPVSVEMSVFESEERLDNLLELKDYKFEAVTVLGSFVTPAIPMAKASLVQFSKEYQDAYNKEFVTPYSTIDFKIPKEVKDVARDALKNYKEKGINATSISLTMAKFLMKNEKITPERIQQMVKFFSKKPNEIETSLDFWGGIEGAKWSKTLYNAIEEIDTFDIRGEKTMPYKNLADINPALKGIEPPITLGQANEIAKQADSIGSDKTKNGWAIAISSFKKTHKIEDEKWVKKEEKMGANESENTGKEKEMMDMAENENEEKEKVEGTPTEEKVEEEKMAEEEKVEEEKMAEKPADEKEEEKEEEKKFSLNAYLDVPALLAYLEAETDDNEEMVAKYAEAKEELGKGEFCNSGKVMSAMYTKMCKMAEKIEKMAEEKEKLEKFKADIESEQKMAEVDRTLKEMAEKVVISDETMAEFRASAENFSFDQLDAWKNECKAKSFDFALKEASDNSHTRIALPYKPNVPKPKNDIWAGVKK